MTPQIRAKKSAAAMWANDAASKWIGMSLDHVDAGAAVVSMIIEAQHLNGHAIGHGGIIYALADTAFAFACNSYNQLVVAQHNSMTYLAPAKLNDHLIATAREVSLAGRSGVYDVSITTSDGRLLAEFRGGSRQISGQHFEETT